MAETYIEVKLGGWFGTSRGFDGATQGEVIAAYAADIYRLLACPSGSAHCALVIRLRGPMSDEVRAAVPTSPRQVPARLDVDADATYQQLRVVAALSAVEAVVAFAEACVTHIGAMVTVLDAAETAPASDVRYLVIEWTQTDSAPSAYVRLP